MIYLRDHGFTLLTFDRWQDIDKVNKPIFITLMMGTKQSECLWYLSKAENEHFKPTGTILLFLTLSVAPTDYQNRI